MRHRGSAAALCIAAVLSANVFAAQAAPDNTPGMAIMAAFVNDDGTLIRGSGVTAASRLGEGSYLVQFDRSVSEDLAAGCYWAATPYFQDIIVAVTRQPTNGLAVVTKYNGNFADSGFSLIVYCSR